MEEMGRLIKVGLNMKRLQKDSRGLGRRKEEIVHHSRYKHWENESQLPWLFL